LGSAQRCDTSSLSA